MPYTNVSADLVNAYRWYRQQDPRNYGGKSLRYPPKMSLAMARADVAKGTKRYPHTGRIYAGQWQAAEPVPAVWKSYTRAYYADTWPTGWRDLGDAHEVGRLDHRGWYTNEFQDEVIRGRVLQLPGRDHKPLYVPGTYSSDSDGVTLYPLDMYDDRKECARSADGYAERAAETEREYNEVWQAGSQASGYADEANAIRSKLIRRIAAHRELRNALREFVAEGLAEIRELRAKRDRLQSEVPSRLRDAFNEGYGT